MSTSLFESLGGKDAVDAAVDIFYQRVMSDPDLKHFFKSTHMKQLRAKQKAFLTMAFGGPNHYTGAGLRAAHAPLVARGLNDVHFNAVAKHLRGALDELQVPEMLAEQVMAIVAGTRNDVLGR